MPTSTISLPPTYSPQDRERIPFNKEYTHSFSDDEYIAFLTNLSSSDRLTNRYWGRLGFLLYDFAYGRNGVRLDKDKAQLLYRDILNALPNEFKNFKNSGDRDVWEMLGLKQDKTCTTVTVSPPTPARILRNHNHHVCLQSIRMNVLRHNGISLPLSDLSWADQNGYASAHLGSYKLSCDKDFDILWNSKSFLLHNKYSYMFKEYLVVDTYLDQGITDVCFDGHNIWVAHGPTGIYVYSKDGILLAHGGEKDGIPPSIDGIIFIVKSPGHVVAIGSIPYPDRSWFSNLSINGSNIISEVFHESYLIKDAASNHSGNISNPNTGFVPISAFDAPIFQTGNHRIKYIVCGYQFGLGGPKASHLLMLDIDEDKVSAVDPKHIPNRTSWLELSNGNCLLLDKNFILHWTHPYNSESYHSKYDMLFDNTPHSCQYTDYFHGDIFYYNKFIYAPANNWIRIHPDTLKYDVLGIHNRCPSMYTSYTTSPDYGLVACNSNGYVLKVLILPCDIFARECLDYVPLNIMSDPPPVCNMRKIVNSIHQFRNYYGIWPLSLSELVPEYYDKLEMNVKYSMICDDVYVLKTVSKCDNESIYAYVFGGFEQGWYLYKNNSWNILDVDHITPLGPEYFGEIHDRRAIQLFNTRIELVNDNRVIYRQKYKYLWKRYKYSEAKEAAIFWIKAHPRDLDARRALIDAERKLESGLYPYDVSTEWQKSARTFASWVMYTMYNSCEQICGKTDNVRMDDQCISTAMHALGYPLAEHESDVYTAEYGLDMLMTGHEYKGHAGRIIEICNIWEKESRSWSTRTNRDYLSYRAIARLRLSEYDTASEDVQAAIKAEREEGFISPINLDALGNAIKTHNVDYKIEYK